MSERKRNCSTFDHVSTEQQLKDTPRKKLLRRALSNQNEYYQQWLRTLKQRNKREEKRIAQLHTIFKELKQKNFLADEHADILQAIGESNVHLLKRFTAKSNISINKKKEYLL